MPSIMPKLNLILRKKLIIMFGLFLKYLLRKLLISLNIKWQIIGNVLVDKDYLFSPLFASVAQLVERLIWWNDRKAMSEGSSRGQLITVMSSNLISTPSNQDVAGSSPVGSSSPCKSLPVAVMFLLILRIKEDFYYG